MRLPVHQSQHRQPGGRSRGVRPRAGLHHRPPAPTAWRPWSRGGHCHLVYDRLTRVQRLLTRNPAPLRSSITTLQGCPVRTRVSNRYYNQDLHRRAFRLGSPPGTAPWAPASIYAPMTCPRRPQRRRAVRRGQCAGLGVIHFRSCPLRQVSRYTLLSGFRLSWPPSCYP